MEQLRLLLIEDNPDDSQLVLREVRRGGYDPLYHRVETADAMAAALQDRTWDLVISDFSLPEFSGPQALAVLKQSKLDIPFLIVSGTVGEETAVAALKAGAHDFLSKNNLQRLLPAIQRELREAAGRAESRLAQERLRESEEALAAVFTASPLPIFTVDVGGCITSWNHAAESAFGWTEQEVAGKRPALALGTGPGGNAWCDAVLSGAVVTRSELTGSRRNGSPITTLVFAAPLHSATGAVTGGVAILNDVTDQRALEEQLRQAQKMEAIGRLAGGIAHDFNNILTAIQGYGALLLGEFPPDSEQHRDVEGIMDSAARAAAFTRQLLTFSRKQVTQPEVLDPNELVSSLLNMLGRVIGTGYTLTFEPGTAVGNIYGDRGQIGQVIMNLVVNARDAMPDGGVITITSTREVRRPEGHVRADGSIPDGPYTAFHICDRGMGMTDDTIEHIFEPFFTTKEASKGTGLGLSTVYGIVAQHNGFMCVRSRQGEGSDFGVYFAEHAGSVSQERTARAHETAADSAKVLVVEDDPAIRKLIRRALENAGFTVRAAEDGAVAMLEVERDPDIDLIVTDLMLPGMTGIEVISRSTQINPRIKSVLISGYSSEDFVLSSEISFLEKPFTPDELLTVVRRILDSRPAHRTG